MRIKVTQKAIGFKIDLDLVPLLEDFCTRNGLKKNTAINKAVRLMVGDTSKGG